jgi:hypothetical protein
MLLGRFNQSGGIELHGTHKLLVYGKSKYLLGRNIDTVDENRQAS